MAHTFNPSTLGGRGRWISVRSRLAWSTRVSSRTGPKASEKPRLEKPNNNKNPTTNMHSKDPNRNTKARKSGVYSSYPCHLSSMLFKIIIIIILLCACAHVCVWRQDMPQCTYTDQRETFRTPFSPPTSQWLGGLDSASTFPRQPSPCPLLITFPLPETLELSALLLHDYSEESASW